MQASHVVTGAGPVGRTVATQLAEAGHHVLVLTRSGSGPSHPAIQRRALDVRDQAALAVALQGAQAVFHCTHAAYTAADWCRELPATEAGVLRAAAGAVVVFPESLYSYRDPRVPMTEDGPRDATGGKRGVRTGLLDARARSATPTVSVVASDLFGPHVRGAHAGERMIPRILSGRRISVFGDPDQPHSFTYIADYARAMVAAAQRTEVWGRVLHAPTGPALTQRALVRAIAAVAGTDPRIGRIPSWVVRVGAIVPGQLRELAEMQYQFTAPFVLDSSRTEALLGLSPTPLDQAITETVAWWRGASVQVAGR